MGSLEKLVKQCRLVWLRLFVFVLSLVPHSVIARALTVRMDANVELGMDRRDQSPFGWRQNRTLIAVFPRSPLHLFTSVAGNLPPNLPMLFC